MNALPQIRHLPTTVALGLAGTLLLLIGTSIVLSPVAYQAGMGVALPEAPTLLSDLRAMGGGLVGVGLLVLAGALRPALAESAARAGGVVYLSYGLSRLVSLGLDGWPSEVLIGSTAIELVVGSVLIGVARLGGR